LLSRRSPGDYLRKLLASLQAQGKIAAPEPKLSYGGIPLKPLSRTCGERLVVVGDAAGQVKPTTGGGIYYGLLCADIAADSLHQALGKGDLTAKGLAGYEQAWRKNLARELKRGYWARKFYERLSDRQVDRLFDIIISTGLDEALLQEEDLTFDWPAEAVLKLLAHRAISRAVGKIKIPFLAGTD
jgi:digeranylgeranylglycerophospholipid reductase